jgi:hypothetical protein
MDFTLKMTRLPGRFVGLLGIACLLSTPAFGQQAGARTNPWDADRAEVPRAEHAYDQAMARAIAAAHNLVEAKTPEHQEEYDVASHLAVLAWQRVQDCRRSCEIHEAVEKEWKKKAEEEKSQGDKSVGLAGLLAYMLMGQYDGGGGMAEVDPPKLQIDESDYYTPPEHSVVNDLKPAGKYTGDLPTAGDEPTFTPPTSQSESRPAPGQSPTSDPSQQPVSRSSSGSPVRSTPAQGGRVTSPTVPASGRTTTLHGPG